MPKSTRGPQNFPWYWSVRDRWFVTPPRGKRTMLRGPDGRPIAGRSGRAAAVKTWQTMTALSDPKRFGGQTPLRVVLELFLVSRERAGVGADVLKQYTRYYKSFLLHIGDAPVDSLTPQVVERWWDTESGWGQSTRGSALRTLMAALNWAAAPGGGGRIIPENPLHGMPVPAVRTRSAQVVVTPEEYATVLAAARPDLKDVLEVLWATGTRPVNLCRATAAHVAADGRSLVFAPKPGCELLPHKAFRKTGREMVVPLPPRATEIVGGLAAKYPEGALFRTSAGTPWKPNYLVGRIGQVAERVGLRGRFTSYSPRHTLATDLLRAGATVEQVAAVLGNSPKVINHHYNHLNSNVAASLETVARVRG